MAHLKINGLRINSATKNIDIILFLTQPCPYKLGTSDRTPIWS